MEEKQMEEVQELSLEEAAEVKGGGWFSWWPWKKGRLDAGGRAGYTAARLG